MKSKLKTFLDTCDKKIAKLQKAKTKAIKQRQSRCKHPTSEIAEAPMCDRILSHRPPMRICLRCGWAEDGWSFYKLKGYDKYLKISRSALESNALGGVHSIHDQYHLEHPERRCDDDCSGRPNLD